MTAARTKICSVCQMANDHTAFMCANPDCYTDLTLIAITVARPEIVPVEPMPSAICCENGHLLQAGDEICIECGAGPNRVQSAIVQGTVGDPTGCSPPPNRVQSIGGVALGRKIAETAEGIETFLSPDNRQKVVLYPPNFVPDRSRTERLLALDHPAFPTLEKAGRENDTQRYFEVWKQEIPDACLLLVPENVPQVAREIAEALLALHQGGLVYRYLDWDHFYLTESGTLCFDSLDRCLSADFGVTLRGNESFSIRSLAPEAAVGSFEEASDWWALGTVLLQGATRGAGIPEMPDAAFLMQLVTRGLPVPADIPEAWQALLQGLLTRDPGKRWRGGEVLRCLDGEPGIPVFYESETTGKNSKFEIRISLGDTKCYTPEQWSVASVQPGNWEEAVEQLKTGVFNTWLETIEAAPQLRDVVGELQGDATSGLDDDERLAIALVAVNARLPLTWKGEIVNPEWLLKNFDKSLQWLDGGFVSHLEKVGRVEWLVQLKHRNDRANALSRDLGITIDSEEFRAASLVHSENILHQRWRRRRRDFPVARVRGLAVLAEKSAPLGEDLLVLISAELDLFTPADVILSEAEEEAKRAGFNFSREQGTQHLQDSRREMLLTLNARIAKFSRCGVERLDEWADMFRYERRISLPQTLVLLQVPESSWQAPPHQEYLRKLFSFFYNRILRGIQRGSLLNLRVSTNSRNIDLAEINGPNQPSTVILNHILRRENGLITIDPAVFTGNMLIERRIRRLSRVAADYFRDTGIQSLYFGYPFYAVRPASASSSAKPKRAPLFLWPVKLNTPMGSRSRIQVAFDRDRQGEFESAGVELNPALVPLLIGGEIDSLRNALVEALSRTSIDHETLYELCAAALPKSASSGPRITRLPQEAPELKHGEGILFSSGAFFVCDFSQQTISQDIRQLQERALADGALSKVLRLNPATAMPTVLGKIPENEKFLVLPSDPSQQRAIFRARQAGGLVVQGPPGTGKSQTIVNILADCIGRNEKALVVCQKHAALEVVARRLTEEGLGDRFFMVEDARRSRQPIIRALRNQVADQSEWRKSLADRERQDLADAVERLEKELSAGALASREAVEGSGLIYTAVLDKLIERQGKQRIEAYDLRSLFLHLTWARVEERVDRISRLVPLWVESRYETSPWQRCAHFSLDTATLNAFKKDLDLWAAAEDARNAIIKETPKIFLIPDVEAFREWEAKFGPWLRSLKGEAVCDADFWSDLWQAEDEFRERLAELKNEAWNLKKPPGYADFGPALIDLSPTEFGRLLKAARAVQKGAGSFFVKLNPVYWLGKKRVSSFLDQLGITDGGDEFHDQIQWETQRRKLVRRLRQFEVQFRQKLSPESIDTTEISGIAGEFERRWTALRGIARAGASCPLAADFREALSTRSAAGISDFLQNASSSLRCIEAETKSGAALDRLQKWFCDEVIVGLRRFLDSRRGSDLVVSNILSEKGRIEPALQFRAELALLAPEEQSVFKKLEASPCRPAFEALPHGEIEAVARTTFETEALLCWKAAAEQKEPALTLSPEDYQRKVQSLNETSQRLREANRACLQRPSRPDLIANAARWMGILGLRGPSAKSTREVLDAGWDFGLFDLRPVWLASPETVSRIFPLREGLFDVVIFDEASQMPVEMAIPTLYRGKRVVISGDRKQLPPTNFFKGDSEDDDDEDEESALDLMDADSKKEQLQRQQSRREVKDCVDLLQLADGELPDCLLSIHYRSRWRQLINFSNSAFYEAKLSVPVHQPDELVKSTQPIEVRQVDGTYHDQTNETEADAVVAYLDELWQEDDPPSVGVVTFNLKQAELIEDKLDARMLKNEYFMRRYQDQQNRGGLECPFVRNLENVQGDERDIIIFSTTFGINQSGKFIRNFGPLGQKGGERRLNVAITRAKEKMVIFTSMPLAEIASSLPGHGSSPRDVLKAYLCYSDAVSSGRFSEAEAILHRLVGESRGGYDPTLFAGKQRRSFVLAVADFLRENGYDPRFGTTDDAFHYDLAIPDPATGLFGLAIECDAPHHHELDSAAAREIWRPSVMKGTIPRIIRISSRSWLENPTREQEKLLLACQFAKTKPKKKK